jgi:hypothetical protein
VQTCLEGIDSNLPVAVEPAAAKLLMPNTGAHRRRRVPRIVRSQPVSGAPCL